MNKGTAGLGVAAFVASMALLAGAVSAWTSVSFWAVFAIGIAAIIANGLLAVIEDDLPGGFNNPDGTTTPRYLATLSGPIRSGAVALFIVIASVIGFASLPPQSPAERLTSAGLAGLSLSAAGLLAGRRRAAAACGACATALLAGAILA